jgi:hypothetical protein
MQVRYPAAAWRPLGVQTEPRITPRILVFHTMVGSLRGTDSLFKKSGYTGTESHFGVGGPWDGAALDGAVWQWQSLDRQADAQNAGNAYATSIETSDGGQPLRAWSAKQLDALVALAAWWCRQTGAPARLVSSTSQSGFGYHAQFTAWAPDGRTCPGRTRIAQLIDVVIPRTARALGSPSPTPTPTPTPSPGGSMALTQDDLNKIAATVWGARFGASDTTGVMLQRAVVDPKAIAAAVVAALPKGTAGPLTAADVEAAVRKVLKEGVG